MGYVFVNAYLEGTKSGEELRALVDTRATYTTISKEMAENIGVLVYPRKFKTRLVDGREVEAKVGMACIRVNEREAPIKVAVTHCKEPLLGVQTLETLGLKVNPETGELEPSRSFVLRV